MTRGRAAGICLWALIASGTIDAQQSRETTGQTEAPASTVVEVTYPVGGITPWRHVQTRTQSGPRENVIATTESPGVDGRFEQLRQVVTETVRTGSEPPQTSREVVEFPGRQRRLVESSAEGISLLPDVNGRLGVGSRQVEETSSLGTATQRTDTVTLVPGINEAMSESERRQYTERMVGPAATRYENVHQRRDVNGGWQTTETRSGETRDVGPTERVTEETIERLDATGGLSVAERSYTRRFEANGREYVDIETYSTSAEGIVRSDGRLALTQRVRRTTTAAADGGRDVVEEVEGRSLAAPNDPLRVIRRSVTTVRRTGPDRWATETQMFELDVNGRMTPVFARTEETAGP